MDLPQLSNTIFADNKSIHGYNTNQGENFSALQTTVKPVYNDHLYNDIYYLWFIQQCVLRKNEGTHSLLLTISAFRRRAKGHLDELQKAEKYPIIGGRYRQVSLYSKLYLRRPISCKGVSMWNRVIQHVTLIVLSCPLNMPPIRLYSSMNKRIYNVNISLNYLVQLWM